MKVLNLYAGIGGNRKLWTDVEVTAVENNESIAAIYQDFFPDDKMIIADAHQYLLDHFKEYDFIWSSPPCPTHTRLNIPSFAFGSKNHEYPDMRLYQEIIFLKVFSNQFVVENVISYYEPLIVPQIIDRHYFWSNVNIPFYEVKNPKRIHQKADRPYLQKFYGFDLDKYDILNKRTILRNCVLPEVGLHILECARGNYNYLKQKQESIFRDKDKK